MIEYVDKYLYCMYLVTDERIRDKDQRSKRKRIVELYVYPIESLPE